MLCVTGVTSPDSVKIEPGLYPYWSTRAYHVYRLAEVFCKMREHLRVYEGRHLKFVGLCGGGGNTGPARSRASGQVVARRDPMECLNGALSIC